MSRFLHSFKTYFLNATDASPEFAEASGLMTLGGIAMGRRWLEYGHGGIKPNLFMMLCGPSTVGRKSTSVKYSKLFLEQVDADRVGPRDYTIEGLLRWMAEKDPVTQKTRNTVGIFAEEFGADLARAEAYASTMATDMCALYDGEDFTKVRAKSATIHVNKPRVMLFAACAYSMLQKFMKPKDWTNGFLMRFMFVAPQTTRQKWVLQPQDPLPLWQQALTRLQILQRDLSQQHMGMTLDPAAAQVFAQSMASLDQARLGPTAQTYRGRFGINVLKLGLLYQLDIDPRMPVSTLAMAQAIDFAYRVCWPSFVTAYTKTAMNDFEGLFFSVIEFLALRHGQIVSRADLAQEFLANERLDGVIEYLKKQGLVLWQKIPNGGEGLTLARYVNTDI